MNDLEIFVAAIKLTGDKRTAFLNSACGQNESLRQRIDELLEAHEDSLGPVPFLNQRDIEATQSLKGHNEVGTFIGPYKLLELIGEGGMGTVWVAEQSKPIRRNVAIKLIKLGMDSKAVLARFEAERQALAMMDHPNIARVLDGGMTDEGRPYFAMEYVKGVPLIEYCDNAKLSVKERLELFMPVCKAVQHAHQKGVIHRDLKPSNILICLYDGKPVPKVIDFGLAKAMHQSLTDKTLHTAHGMMVGTPLYMSPEQAESNNLDVDTRTDIYSLGVILYELLTGSTPLEKAQLKDAAVGEILRLIKEVEPPKPSTRVSASKPNVAAQRSIDSEQLSRSVRGDLDWVVMKALEKERSRRYETANGLAEDIRRHLSDEPVVAGPPSRRYRVQKFIKRNRAVVMAATAVAFALLLGIAGTTGGMFWALNEREEANRQRARAEQREREAIDAVRRFGDAVANNPELKNRPDLESLRKTLLEEPLQYFKSIREQLEAEAVQNPHSLHLLAKAAYDLGFLNDEIGDKQNALSAYRQALEISERLAGEKPDVTDYQYLVAISQFNVGNLLHATGQTNEAMAAYQTVRDKMEQLAHENPTVIDYQGRLADSHHAIGNLLNATGQSEEGMVNYQQALKIRKRMAAEHPSVTVYQSQFARSKYIIAVLLNETGQLAEAMETHVQALEIRQRLVRDNPSVTLYQSDLAHSLFAIAMLHGQTGQQEEAMAAYRQAIKIQERLTHEHPSVTSYQSDLANSRYNFGNLLEAIGETEEAIEAYRQAMEIREQLARDNPTVNRFQYSLSESHNIGHLLRKTGQSEEALAAFRRSLEIQKRLARDNPNITEFQYRLAECYNAIGIMLSESGKSKEAMAAYEQALNIREQLIRDNPTIEKYRSGVASIHNNIGLLLQGTNQSMEAMAAYKKSREILERLVSENPTITQYQRDLAASQRSIGIILSEIGQPDEAMAAFRQTVGTFEALVRDNPAITEYQERLGESLNSLGAELQVAGHKEEAMAAYKQALAIREGLVGDNPRVIDYQSRLADSHYNIGSLLKSTGQPKEALVTHLKALEVRERLVRDNPSVTQYQHDLATSHNNIAELLIQAGQNEDAMTVYMRAVEIKKRLVRDNPSVAQYQHDLATIQRNIGDLLRESGQSEEAMAHYQKALQIQENLILDVPDNADFQSELGATLNNFAVIDMSTHQLDAARDKLAKAVEYQKKALALNDKNQRYRQFLANHYSNLIRTAERLNDRGLLLEAKRGQLELARPTDGSITEAYATTLNNFIWPLVKLPVENDELTITSNELDEMRRAVEAFPRGIYYNTLGTAEYRMGNYKSAIAACNQSLKRSPKELNLSGPHPIDLAIVAMSHHQLGNNGQAEACRLEFEKAMKAAEFKDDEECKSFAAELMQLLGPTNAKNGYDEQSMKPVGLGEQQF